MKSNKRRSRTAIFSVNLADKNLVSKTTNRFYTSAKLDENHVDGDLSKEFKPIALDINQFESRHTNNINWIFLYVQLINIPI